MAREDDLRREALQFLDTMRGNYIISQALCVAIREMEKVEDPHKELSNIEDMKFLRDNLFVLYHIAEKAQAVIREMEETSSEQGN